VQTSATLGRRARLPVFFLLLIVAFTAVYPVVFMTTTALRTNTDYLKNPFGLPSQFTLQNFRVLFTEYNLGQTLLNSSIVVSVGVASTVVLSVLAAYAMAKFPVPGARFLNSAFVSVMLIPSQVLIIPVYLLLSRMGLVNEYAGLILVYVAVGIPFSVFFLTLSFKSIPDSLVEAARLDGAGFFRTLVSIILPIGRASIATLAILQFLSMWNELLFAYILMPDETKKLITPAVTEIGTRLVSDQPLLSAGLLITSMFPILLLALLSRYVVQGFAAGIGR